MMLREPSPSMLGKCQRDRGKIDPSGRESSSSILRNETVQQSASITSRAKAASFDWGLLIVGVSPTAVNQPRIRLHWKPFFFRLGQSTYCTTSARLLCRCAPAILWSWNFAWSYWLMIFSARWNFAFISQPHTCIGCSSLLAPSAMKQKLKIHSSHFARTALPLQSIWSMQLTLILSLLYSQISCAWSTPFWAMEQVVADQTLSFLPLILTRRPLVIIHRSTTPICDSHARQMKIN